MNITEDCNTVMHNARLEKVVLCAALVNTSMSDATQHDCTQLSAQS